MPSYGGIYTASASNYVGMTAPALGAIKSYIASVDGILLTSAGMVARCDPCVVIKGKIYPTVLSSSRGVINQCSSQQGDIRDAVDISRKIASTCSAFCSKYISAIATLFKTTGGEEVASSCLNSLFGLNAGKEDRHLCYKTVAPWYWIEPTSLFKQRNDDFVSEKAGYGVIVGTKDQPFEMSAFEDMKVHEGSSYYYLDCSFRSARVSGFVLHHQNNLLYL